MDFLQLLQSNLLLLIFTVSVFSLMIGSFLNAVIYRVPIMLEQEWKHDCLEILGKASDDGKHRHISLMTPGSQCPKCSHRITALENIPVLSYLVLGGKCSACKHPISIQYPIVELVTAAISGFLAWKLGYGLPLVGLLLFTWVLIVLFMIDAQTYFLPDNITLPLLWLGVLFNIDGTYADLQSSVIGAVAGYLVLWTIYQLFKLFTGKEGMGFGDFKLLAAIGAWGGWQVLPFVVFISSVLGAIIGSIWLYLIAKKRDSQAIPFGPWLALGGFIAVVWRDDVVMLLSVYGI